jgi:4a-hydroxytetrahydrobiopterin dehydratase
MTKLQPTDAERAMASLSGWTLSTHPQHHIPCLSKSWTLPSFEAAVVRFNQIAQLAHAQNHHPEVLSSHTHLHLRIWTHEVAGLTDQDVTLAHSIDALVE